jgi:phosphoglycerate kinase
MQFCSRRKVILMSHLGRPGLKKYSLKHILKTTSDVLGKAVEFVSDCIGEQAKNAAAKLQAGEVYCWKTYVFIKRKNQEMLLLQKNWRW